MPSVCHVSQVGVAFPLLIAALIPLRSRVLPKLISDAELAHLDPAGVPPEVAGRESVAVRESLQRGPSLWDLGTRGSLTSKHRARGPEPCLRRRMSC